MAKKTHLPRGEPEFPLSDNELFDKVKRVTSPFFPAFFLERLWQIVVEDNINQVQYLKIIDLFGEVTNEREILNRFSSNHWK